MRALNRWEGGRRSRGRHGVSPVGLQHGSFDASHDARNIKWISMYYINIPCVALMPATSCDTLVAWVQEEKNSWLEVWMGMVVVNLLPAARIDAQRSRRGLF